MQTVQFMAQTKFNHLINEELLSVALERDRSGSDLLQELINRLEKLDKVESREGVNTKVECPCCEASLDIDFDPHNNLYEVKVDKHV